MAHVISTINMKGGVAKTTTSVALAEVFSAEMRKKVLVIDLDPQTNATIMLLGEDKWLELNNQGYTLAQLFKDAMNPDVKKFDLNATLQKRVGDVQEARTIDLLPSSLDLIDVQDQLAVFYMMRFGAGAAVVLGALLFIYAVAVPRRELFASGSARDVAAE